MCKEGTMGYSHTCNAVAKVEGTHLRLKDRNGTLSHYSMDY